MNTYTRQSVVNYGRQQYGSAAITLTGFSGCFSHGETNYLITSDVVIPTSREGWVLLRIDRDSGQVLCTVEDWSIEYAPTLPLTSEAGIIVFNTTDNTSYRRFNNEWVEDVAMNIGRVYNSIYDKQAKGSQIGTVENVYPGVIFLDQDNKPLVFRNGNRYRFATISDNDNIKLDNGIFHFSFDGSVGFGVASSPISAFTVVAFSPSGTLQPYNGSRSPVGITIDSVPSGGKVVFVSSGYVYNAYWSFDHPRYSVQLYDDGSVGQGVSLSQNYIQTCGKAVTTQGMFIDFAQRIKVLDNESI